MTGQFEQAVKKLRSAMLAAERRIDAADEPKARTINLVHRSNIARAVNVGGTNERRSASSTQAVRIQQGRKRSS
jgi:hypothetical protein